MCSYNLFEQTIGQPARVCWRSVVRISDNYWGENRLRRAMLIVCDGLRDGVVGEQPNLQPGEEFTYTSAAIIETPVGSMHGTYQMISEDGVEFDAVIPPFSLSIPNVVH